MISFTTNDLGKVVALQADLTVVLQRANASKVEAALAIFALCRCARKLLYLYPPATRKMLVTTLVAFLEGKTEDPHDRRLVRLH